MAGRRRRAGPCGPSGRIPLGVSTVAIRRRTAGCPEGRIGAARRSTGSFWPDWNRRDCGRRRGPSPGNSSAGCTFDLIGLPPTPEESAKTSAPRSNAIRGRHSRRWSIDCWPARITASGGVGTGWTWPTTPTATAGRRPRSAQRLPLSRFRDSRIQRRYAVRSIRPLANRRGRIRTAESGGRGGNRVSGSRAPSEMLPDNLMEDERLRATLQRTGRHAVDDRHRVPRPDAGLRPLPRSQIRRHPGPRLLPPDVPLCTAASGPTCRSARRNEQSARLSRLRAGPEAHLAVQAGRLLRPAINPCNWVLCRS